MVTRKMGLQNGADGDKERSFSRLFPLSWT